MGREERGILNRGWTRMDADKEGGRMEEGRLMELTAKNARITKIWAGVCAIFFFVFFAVKTSSRATTSARFA
jgi:hypothetical protein